MKILFSTLLFCLFSNVSVCSWSEPRVLASIKPLALIAKDLLGDLATVETLLPPTADPHHYNLRVSDRGRIEQADFIIWMGPGLERFLVKPLEAVDSNRKLAVANSTQLEIMDQNPSHRENSDPHSWLDPQTAITLSREIARHLAIKYPELESAIEERLANRVVALANLDQHLRQRLAVYRDEAFLADHPAYQTLVDTYSLRQVDSVHEHDEVGLSASHLANLNAIVKTQRPSCILVRQGHQNKTLQTWSQRWQLPLVTIDVLGADVAIENYQDLMAAVAAAIEVCFHSD
jgi:zinc transport system substrate-binding protein